jgi:seryl-tRNA synthetase
MNAGNMASEVTLNFDNGDGGNPNGGGAVSKGRHRNEMEKHQQELDKVIEDLDKKLNRVLAKQEYEYLKGYNIYVKQKEKDLRELIEKLNEKNSNNTLKDEKISKLESTISAIREDQIRQEKEKEKLLETVKYWKTKA